jgi:hypothetical protein
MITFPHGFRKGEGKKDISPSCDRFGKEEEEEEQSKRDIFILRDSRG